MSPVPVVIDLYVVQLDKNIRHELLYQLIQSRSLPWRWHSCNRILKTLNTHVLHVSKCFASWREFHIFPRTQRVHWLHDDLSFQMVVGHLVTVEVEWPVRGTRISLLRDSSSLLTLDNMILISRALSVIRISKKSCLSYRWNGMLSPRLYKSTDWVARKSMSYPAPKSLSLSRDTWSSVLSSEMTSPLHDYCTCHVVRCSPLLVCRHL